MNFSNAVSTCFSKYATFSGRASRSEYWWFYLFTVLMGWGATISAAMLSGPDGANLASTMAFLIFLIPMLSAGSRRLHDAGRSGWWQWLILTRIGVILLLIWWAMDSQKEVNK